MSNRVPPSVPLPVASLSEIADFRDEQALGAVRPQGVDQIMDVIRWANREKVPLLPLSSPGGARRRRSTRCAQAALIVDLSRNASLIHADEENRIAIVEPGVRFGDIDQSLRPHGLRAFKPLLPRAGKSVLANCLEREPTTSPYNQWDTSDPLAAVEVVFGNGEYYRTGGAAVPGTLQENLARGSRQMMSGGPQVTDFTRVLQGSQGSLGIVCWGSIYCEPLPALEKGYFVASSTLQPLLELAYRCCWRRTSGQLFIVNSAQLNLLCQAMGRAMDPSLPASEWTLCANLTASPYFPEENLAYATADFLADAASYGVSPTEELGGLAAAQFHQSLQTPINGDYKAVTGGYDDLLFLSQLDKTEKLVAAMRAGLPAASPPALYIQPMVHGVCCHVEASFTQEHFGTQRASVRDSAARICVSEGAFLSRPYQPWGTLAFAADPAAKDRIAVMKKMFDPNGIMNPGCFA